MVQKLKFIKMKKIVIAILIFVGSFSFASAQSKTKHVHKKETTTSKTAATTNLKDSKATTAHLKKDGTADKRYKENKMKAKAAGPLKKNGTPDKRYKANKK
jgi:hypothetical protein